MLDNRLRERLAFESGIDWTSGLAASLKGQIDFLMGEMKRHGGVVNNPVTLASLTDLVVSLVLRGTISWSGLEAAASVRFRPMCGARKTSSGRMPPSRSAWSRSRPRRVVATVDVAPLAFDETSSRVRLLRVVATKARFATCSCKATAFN
jgi:hypothetical protein